MRHKAASRARDCDKQSDDTARERRTAPRIQTPLQAIVRTVEAHDQQFEETVVLENLSSRGLYLQLSRQLAPGTRLSVLLRFSLAPTGDATVAWMELRGIVLRSEPRPHDRFGTALRFTSSYFTYSWLKGL